MYYFLLRFTLLHVVCMFLGFRSFWKHYSRIDLTTYMVNNNFVAFM